MGCPFPTVAARHRQARIELRTRCAMRAPRASEGTAGRSHAVPLLAILLATALGASLMAAQVQAQPPPTTTCAEAAAAVASCYDDPVCTSCYRDIVQFAVNASTNPDTNKKRERDFFEYIWDRKETIRDTCGARFGATNGLVYEISRTPSYFCANITFTFSQCQNSMLICTLMPGVNCGHCLRNLYNAADGSEIDKREAVSSAECKNLTYDFSRGPPIPGTSPPETTSQFFLALMASQCVSLPTCTIAKQACLADPTCATCADDVEAGRYAAAAASCKPSKVSALTEHAVLLEGYITQCTFGTEIGCDFGEVACQADPGCSSCFEEIKSTFNVGDSINNSAACSTIRGELMNSSRMDVAARLGTSVLVKQFLLCPRSFVSSCSFTEAICIQTQGKACIECILNHSADLSPTYKSDTCSVLLGADTDSGGFLITAECKSCPRDVYNANVVVVATSVVGGISLIGALCVIAVIIAYSKDRVWSRERILVGLMISNAIYSSANMAPLNLMRLDGVQCGELFLPFDGIRFGRGWWFLGKYAIVAFEFAIVVLSAVALKKGIRKIKGRVEAATYAACATVGLIAFAIFYGICYTVNRDGYNSESQTEASSPSQLHLSSNDDLDDDLGEFSIQAETSFARSRDKYDKLVQIMLVVWVGLAGVTLAAWVYVWRITQGLLTQLTHMRAGLDAGFDRDNFAMSQSPGMLRKRRLLDIARQSYDEIAGPLQPYVVIFLGFCVPAAVMATDYCRKNSGRENAGNIGVTTTGEFQVGMCDIWCEFALAFRTLAAVLLYFARRTHRDELFNVPELARRLRSRVVVFAFRICPALCWCGDQYVTDSRGVSFSDSAQVRFLGDVQDDDEYGAEHDDSAGGAGRNTSYAAAVQG